ncbi:MAG TPA: hypothetical protein VGQ59_11335, partial [Cyclobacteriaceae bacterium]|nr:hypothetical protein [Cyclobacteriaceae bacterium]
MKKLFFIFLALPLGAYAQGYSDVFKTGDLNAIDPGVADNSLINGYIAANATEEAATAAASATSTAAGTKILGSGADGAAMAVGINTQANLWVNLQRTYQWFQSHVVHSAAAQNTAQLVRGYNNMKNMVGIIGATVGNVQTLTQQFQNDLKSRTTTSQQMMTELNDFLSWKSALAGFSGKPTPYAPIFNFANVYESETSVFRDGNGNLSLTAGILSATDDRYLAAHLQNYQGYLLKIQQNQSLIHDMEIREHLRLAQSFERQARWLNLKLNTQIFGRAVVDLSQDFSFLANSAAWSPGKSSYEDISVNGNTMSQLSSFSTRKFNFFSDSATTNSKGKVAAQDKELTDMMNQMYDYLNKASYHRSQAYTKLYKLMYQQMNPFNLDLYQIRMLTM